MSGISGPKIITSGCVLSLDAADKLSYRGSGTTWRDLSGNNNNGTLTNTSYIKSHIDNTVSPISSLLNVHTQKLDNIGTYNLITGATTNSNIRTIETIPIANNKIGILPKCQPVLEFIKNCPCAVTKVFIKAAIHHFENRVEVLTEIYRHLPTGGKCLIVTLSNNCENLPLFTKALSVVKDMPNFFNTLIDEIKQTKFSFTIQEKNYVANITKNNWFDMLRGKFISTLNAFSDADIDEGIQELMH